ncbi:trehalase [Lewinellaceae bacterium SD302]|nr:trehalase [Lewinellaceae bacterium SD302]
MEEVADKVAMSANDPAVTASETDEALLPPDILFGELFQRVQMERIFEDGKTFVDMIPRMPAAEIMENYHAAAGKIDTNLEAFVLEHFDLPFDPNTDFASDESRDIVAHINALWPVLTRKAGEGEGAAGSLIPLPKDYIVPGGRFREIYYWDSYFTMLGLKAAGEDQRIRDMVDNFAYLIDEIGFIPNGNRTYYLTRSQPPFFAAMVSLLVSIDGPSVYAKYLDPLRKEYDWWMKGYDEDRPITSPTLHLVPMPSGAVLNRYYDAGDRPRAESYREDVLTIRESGRDSATVARHLRSGAESGWDYSSRWLADGKNLHTIETTDIVPADLNALLYQTELTLELAYRNTQNPEMAKTMQSRRKARRAAMQTFLWNPASAWYEDYHIKTGKPTGRLSLAGMYPFYFDVASENHAEVAFKTLEDKFLAPGGVRSTLVESGQQWDAPNGWPPLQYLTIGGLRKYKSNELAAEIEKRWLANNERVYQNVTKMVEKYNVEDLSLLAGGGEYPVQDGFGWSNGVYLALWKD